ncbi:MAG: ribonuclease H-like domain-containing protein [Planctomycetales bacterium]|nr:ribonuclease H-like domain-containing protein [Planctomycetales bacterium]
MDSDHLRRSLEQLNRGPMPAATSSPAARSAGAATTATPSSQARNPRLAKVVKTLPGLVRRGDAVANDAGEHWRVVLPVDELWPAGERLVAAGHQRLAAAAELCRASGMQAFAEPDLVAFLEAFPGDALLLDLETCGLAGSALFLAGVLRAVDGRLCVELLLARNYAEEQAVLASLWQRVTERTVLVTFNGKSFDWPMVADRTARHLLFRGRVAPQPRHVDLLHPARRRWRHALPDCRLQTLETHICGRRRGDDIPGSQIPAAYQQYVRTGFTREMDQVLMHNALDLVTLLDLAMRLAGP